MKVTNKDIAPIVTNPCINVCNGPLTSSEDGVCTGCYRTIAECEEWPRASDWRRLQILDNCEERRQALGNAEQLKGL